MLLSEFITTLVLIAYLLLFLRWFRERRGGSLLAFASGGALGLQLLLRTQSAFIAPGVLLLALLVFWPDWKKWIVQSVLFAVGLVLAISPWLMRNYVLTGQASLDDPIQIKAVASMYSGGTPTSNFPLFEGQTPEEISHFVVDIILEQPGYVAGFVTNQFLANTIDTLLVLPIFARYDGLSAPIYLYWYEWDASLACEYPASYPVSGSHRPWYCRGMETPALGGIASAGPFCFLYPFHQPGALLRLALHISRGLGWLFLLCAGRGGLVPNACCPLGRRRGASFSESGCSN